MDKSWDKLTCWIIGEGLAGTENQCIGIAEALGVDYTVKRINLREPWKSFSPYLGLEQWWAFKPLLYAPWPDLVIGAGRKAIAPMRYIKKASDGKCFTVFLQDPKCAPEDFDLIAVPAHDSLRGDNVITTIASPNRITQQKLNIAKKQFAELSKHPSPRVAVLIGGNSKTHKITMDIAQNLCGQLAKLEAPLMITCSRRTPKDIQDFMRNELSDHIFWDGEGENPYLGYLAYADYILVTNDSASMLSDAASTGKPVYSIELDGRSAKFDQLYKNLQKHGAMKPFSGKLEYWEYQPLNDAQKVANSIKEKMKDFKHE